MLKQFWRFLFGGHDHVWEQVEKNQIARYNKNGKEIGITHEVYILRCKHCGEMKNHRVAYNIY